MCCAAPYKTDRAFVLAAGKGTRLRPYTDDLPKPMVPVCGRPIIEHTLDKLETHGVDTVVVNLNYLGDKIENYFSSRQTPKIVYSHEEELLDTGGGIKKGLSHFNGRPFFIINGDAFWSDGPNATTFERLDREWNPASMDILLLLQPVSNMIFTKGIGDYNLDASGRASRSLDQTGKYMFGGIRIANPKIFDGIKEQKFSFLHLMDQAEKNGRLNGLVHDGEWHHISTPADLDQVNEHYGHAPAIRAGTSA
jgi:MurNAc alpha-1-phosphate uridylyltransferase